MKLPKEYLSWSAYELWGKNKNEFRRRYYEGAKPSYVSPEMLFGSEVATMLEENHTDLVHVPRGTHAELRIRTVLGEVPVLCYLDAFDDTTNKVIEYKTSRVGWDQARVDNHGQLTMYASAVRKKYGTYNPEVMLVWLETERGVKTDPVFGFEVEVPCMGLTGRVETFTRILTDDDLNAFEKELNDTARAIEADYMAWLSQRWGE